MAIAEGFSFHEATQEDMVEVFDVFLEAFKDDEFTKIIWGNVDKAKIRDYTQSYLLPRW